MAVGILFESEEWSSYKLCEEVNNMGIKADLIDLKENIKEETLLDYEMLVSRIFASSVFRGNGKALEQMPKVIEFSKKNQLPMINSYEAHYYEISKQLSTAVLKEKGISVPEVYGVYNRNELLMAKNIEFPCVAKPDCGGRSNSTYIFNNKTELEIAMKDALDINYIVQEYINPQYGFLTRIEVIDNECKLILKRSVTENGLSSYNLGSVYSSYSECREEIKNTAIKAMNLLSIESGSMDIIENDKGFFIIDVNSVSNASEDNTEMFNFDLMKETAEYISKKYNEVKKN